MPFFLGDAFFESTFHEMGMTLGPLTRRTSRPVRDFFLWGFWDEGFIQTTLDRSGVEGINWKLNSDLYAWAGNAKLKKLFILTIKQKFKLNFHYSLTSKNL